MTNKTLVFHREIIHITCQFKDMWEVSKDVEKYGWVWDNYCVFHKSELFTPKEIITLHFSREGKNLEKELKNEK